MTQAWSKQSILAACLDCDECGLYVSTSTLRIYRVDHKLHSIFVYNYDFQLHRSTEYYYDSYKSRINFTRVSDLDTLLEKLKDYYGL